MCIILAVVTKKDSSFTHFVDLSDGGPLNRPCLSTKLKKLLNPQRTGVFYKRKEGGAIMVITVISARSYGKRLIFQGTNILVKEKYFVKESKRFGHNCLN